MTTTKNMEAVWSVGLGSLQNVISLRHLTQIGKTNLSDGPQLAVHRHEALLHHGFPLGIIVTVKDGA